MVLIPKFFILVKLIRRNLEEEIRGNNKIKYRK